MVKYPEFSELPLNKQIDILTDEIASDVDGRSIEMVLEEVGATQDDYFKIIRDKNYAKMMHDKSYTYKMLPHLPSVYERLGQEAAGGDKVAMKLVLQTGDKLSPENVTIINENLLHMDTSQLKKELAQLMLEAEELGAD